jgi:hypothetical protein
LERIEEERRLYAFAPCRSEVLRQLICEGLAFRRANRPPPKPPKGVPFPGLYPYTAAIGGGLALGFPKK